MNRRKLLGAFTLGLLLLVGWGSRYVPGFSQGNWQAWWKLAFVIALCAAIVITFYDRKNFLEAWDFNPKRGLLYFLLGLIIFPVMVGVDAIFGADLSLSRMVVGTLAMSLVAGILGMFTENVGV